MTTMIAAHAERVAPVQHVVEQSRAPLRAISSTKPSDTGRRDARSVLADHDQRAIFSRSTDSVQLVERIDAKRRVRGRIVDRHLSGARWADQRDSPAACSTTLTPRAPASSSARRDRSRAEQPRGCAGQVEDGGFQADGRRAAVDDQVDRAVEIGQHVLGPGRRDPVRPVRARGRDRLAHSLDQAASDRSRREHARRRCPCPAVTSRG